MLFGLSQVRIDSCEGGQEIATGTHGTSLPENGDCMWMWTRTGVAPPLTEAVRVTGKRGSRQSDTSYTGQAGRVTLSTHRPQPGRDVASSVRVMHVVGEAATGTQPLDNVSPRPPAINVEKARAR